MNHQRSPCWLGAAPLAAAFLLDPPAEAALAGVTPASDTLQVFAEGAVATGQGLDVAWLAPGDAIGAALTEIQDVVLSMEYDTTPGAP